VIVMDVWHWTSLVALLAYAGLQSIPTPIIRRREDRQASRWAVFRYIELPKMKGVLTDRGAAALHGQLHDLHRALRLTGGGPGNATTFLSIDLVKIALGQFDLGPAAAFSIIYFLVILLLSWVFYTVMTNADKGRNRDPPRAKAPARKRAPAAQARQRGGDDALHPVPDAADLLAAEHERSRPTTRSSAASRCGRESSRSRTTSRSSPIRPGIWAMSTR
jgi:ABC-type Fe3+ transport system permease subunit